MRKRAIATSVRSTVFIEANDRQSILEVDNDNHLV